MEGSAKNKALTKILIVCAVLFALSLTLFLADTAAVRGGNKPVFACCFRRADDGCSGRYFGLGYWFDIKGQFLPDVPEGLAVQNGVREANGFFFGIRLARLEPTAR